MSTEQNKELARRFIEEVFNDGDLAAIDELLAPDALDHNPVPGQAPGSAGVKQIVAMWRAAFPDLRFTLEDQLAEGDKVVDRWTFRGTHRGELMGVPPTGKAVAVSGIDIVRVADGKMVEHWVALDQLGLLQQLGVVPAPEQAPA